MAKKGKKGKGRRKKRGGSKSGGSKSGGAAPGKNPEQPPAAPGAEAEKSGNERKKEVKTVTESAAVAEVAPVAEAKAAT